MAERGHQAEPGQHPRGRGDIRAQRVRSAAARSAACLPSILRFRRHPINCIQSFRKREAVNSGRKGKP